MVLIAALSSNFVIGSNGVLPWYVSDDLKFFRNITMGKKVLFGRTTFESVGPLRGRQIYVITRDRNYKPDNVSVVHSVDDVPDDVFVAGGEKVYNTFLPLVDKMYITLIKGSYEGDAFFPRFGDEFELIETIIDTPIMSVCLFERNKNHERNNPWCYSSHPDCCGWRLGS